MKKTGILKERDMDSTEIKEDSLMDLMFNLDTHVQNQHNYIADLPVDIFLCHIKSILGYKIIITDKNEYMAKSIYAFSDDDFFLFRVLEGSRIEFIKTPYLRQWRIFYEKYITQGKSISAFLSAVNLELFNMKTFE